MMLRVGSRRQVWNGTAQETAGGLKRADLKLNKWGRLVSKARSAKAKKEKRLTKAGWTAKKGSFGAVRISKMRM